MSLHALADDAAGGDIESSKQCRRPIAFVIVGHGPGPTFLHRQPGLGAVKRLDLALFVDREHDGFVRRIGNSQAVGYAIRVGMTWLGGAARVWRILQPCFLAVETTDLRRAKI